MQQLDKQNTLNYQPLSYLLAICYKLGSNTFPEQLDYCNKVTLYLAFLEIPQKSFSFILPKQAEPHIHYTFLCFHMAQYLL